ncbi:MAG: response regulator transcription factor [Caldilineaceae bacterium]
MPYSIFIVEDHAAIRLVYTKLINREADLSICGEAAAAQTALAFFATIRPDLVLVDIALPGMSGLALVEQLQGYEPPLLALVISGHEEELYAQQALRSGARGYLIKDGMAAHLIPAIHQILAGKLYLSPQLHHLRG